MKYSALLACLAGTIAQSQDYFPLHVGNQWIYRTEFARLASLTVVDVPRAETIGDQTYSVVRGFETGPVLLRQTEGGTLYRYDPETKAEEVWAVFSTKEGDTYRTAITPCNPTARVESRSAKVTVPAGEFSNALAIRYPAANCADAGLESEAYAPYIGLIERTATTIAGPRRMQLVYARVGGVTVLSGPEISFSLALDKTQYAAGETASVRLAIRNTTAAPLTLDFNSSQRYDLAIRDAAGVEVYRWSATRSFSAVAGSEAIAGGERNFADRIPLPDKPGRYTLDAWLSNSQPSRYAATVGFDIR